MHQSRCNILTHLTAVFVGMLLHHSLAAQQITERTLHVDGFARSYLVHVPPGRSGSRRPVVMMLHGRGENSQSAARDFQWVEKADHEAFIVVFPQALPVDPSRPAGSALPTDLIEHWNFTTNDAVWWTHTIAANYPSMANPRYPRIVHPADSPYLDAVFRDVTTKDGADTDRAYVAGFSSGGEMVSDFAGSSTLSLAAVAIVGSVGLDCPRQLTRPISAFLAIGTDDASTAATWNSMPPAARKSWFGVTTLPTLETDAAAWAELDGCRKKEVKPRPWGQAYSWGACLNETKVTALSVAHLGHEWPGSKPSNWNHSHPDQLPLDLTDEIWDFFSSR